MTPQNTNCPFGTDPDGCSAYSDTFGSGEGVDYGDACGGCIASSGPVSGLVDQGFWRRVLSPVTRDF